RAVRRVRGDEVRPARLLASLERLLREGARLLLLTEQVEAEGAEGRRLDETAIEGLGFLAGFKGRAHEGGRQPGLRARADGLERERVPAASERVPGVHALRRHSSLRRPAED